VRKEAGRGKNRFKIRDLLADERCSQAVLDPLSATDVGRLVLAEEDAGSEVSVRERREREEERRAEVEELGTVGSCRCSCPYLPSWCPQTRNRGWARFPL